MSHTSHPQGFRPARALRILALHGAAVVLCSSLVAQAQGVPAPQKNSTSATAQPEASTAATTATSPQTRVPRLIEFSGVLKDLTGKRITGPADVTFALYSQQAGGAPLWFETQTLDADSLGRYTVLLGAMTPQGVPLELFTSGEAHWVGVQVGNLPEQPRVLLLSVPYALKAGDAETLGGKPPSAYMLAPQLGSSSETSTATGTTLTQLITPPRSNVRPLDPGGTSPQAITPGGTANYLAGWVNGSTLGTSDVYQDPTTDSIGVGTAGPTAALHVQGPVNGLPSTSGSALESSVRVSGGGTVAILDFGSKGAGPAAGWIQARNSGDYSTDYNLLLNPNGGQVGVGTVGPTAALHVWGPVNGLPSASGSAVESAIRVSGGGTSAILDFGSKGAGPAAGWIQARNSGNYNANYNLLLNPNGGNVGIGTSSPAAVLEVNGTAKFDSTVAFATGQTFAGDGSGLSGLNPANIAPGTAAIDISGSAASAANAAALNGVAGSSYARLDTANTFTANQRINANMGIQTSPSNRLTVLGPSGQAATKAIGVTPSTEGASIFGSSTAGAWGDSGSAIGVAASSDGGNALVAVNNQYSQSNPIPTLVAYNYSNSPYGIAASIGGPSKRCNFDAVGDYACFGSKSAVVPLDSGQKVLLYTVESPEVWFEDVGTATLSAGSATVALDPVFAQTVDLSAPYHVFLTPLWDCKGLYVRAQSSGGFEVRELQGGTSNISFDYRVVAHRRGYQSRRLDDAGPLASVSASPAPTAQ